MEWGGKKASQIQGFGGLLGKGTLSFMESGAICLCLAPVAPFPTQGSRRIHAAVNLAPWGPGLFLGVGKPGTRSGSHLPRAAIPLCCLATLFICSTDQPDVFAVVGLFLFFAWLLRRVTKTFFCPSWQNSWGLFLLVASQ